jgi:DNA-binding transcriptional LysR family regulator
MDIEGIRLFVIAADLLNISAAGSQLSLAPAVASARLAKLEKQLGANLFHRSTRKVSLSIEGNEFLPYAKEILAQENAARAALGIDSPNVSGTLRFAASSTFAQLYIAPILPEFLERFPNIDLKMSLSDIPTSLIEGGFDLALRNSSMKDSDLRARKIADDIRILCASPQYLKKHGTPHTPKDLIDHQMVLFRDVPPRKLISSDEKSSCTFPPPGTKKRVTCDDGATMRIATSSGAGISMNSHWSVCQQLKTGKLVRVLPDYQVDDGSVIWLVYPKSNILTAKVRVFIDFLMEKLTEPLLWEH